MASYSKNSKIHRDLKADKGQRGEDVKTLQRAINARARARSLKLVEVDGECGPATISVGRTVARSLGLVLVRGGLTKSTQNVLRFPEVRSKAQLARAKAWERKQAQRPLGEKAYIEANKLIGVMEQGGNNRGRAVEKIIREGGGIPGQAWCGWFCATCYKRAGSKAVAWQWGAVRLMSLVTGVRRTSTPKRGDLVRFTFDHVGMFIKDNGDGTITTIEGNTGATGAVSDSVTGGDGVYRKVRPKLLVRDYLRVSK